MEHLLQSGAGGVSFWRSPPAWLRSQKLSRPYWIFFLAALFFDFAFQIYFFLFNLYLLDLHFNERAIGLVGGAITLGSVAGTLPVGILARKYGVRPLLLVCFVSSPLLGALRVLIMPEKAQIVLSFIYGLSMCLWGVCFLPAIARLTTDENRQSAFSLIFSAGICTSTLSGILCSYAPQWIRKAGFIMQPADVKRNIILFACAFATLGVFAILRLHLPASQDETPAESANNSRWKFDPFLMRFLPAMAVWTIVVTSFSPFANVYLAKFLHMPFSQIGFVFSTVQVVQFILGLLTPLLFRAIGLINGITATQLATGLAIGLLAATHSLPIAIVMYLYFSAMQWMTAPGMYNLLMTRVPDKERSMASSMMMFCNALTGAASTAATGILFTRFGYPPVMVGIAAVAVLAAIALRILVVQSEKAT